MVDAATTLHLNVLSVEENICLRYSDLKIMNKKSVEKKSTNFLGIILDKHLSRVKHKTNVEHKTDKKNCFIVSCKTTGELGKPW